MTKKKIKYGQLATYAGLVVRSIRSTTPADCDNCCFLNFRICPFNDRHCSFLCATPGYFKLVKQ